MLTLKVTKQRIGAVLRTTMQSDSHGSVESWSMFSDIDNLNTKTISEAENNYEKTFITVRDFLEEQKDEQHNLVSEAARLSLTQGIADILRQAGLIRKECE
jgi:hypothetical protein